MTFPRLLCVLALAPCALGALAASASAADVVVGGTLIQRIRTPYDGRTPQQRADQVQERLNAALGQGPILPADISVSPLNDDWCVLFRGRRLMTVDPAGAKQNGYTPQAQAEAWASRLRQVLPSLTSTTGK